MRFGIDRLLAEPALRRPLAGRRVALLAHPASVTRDLTHSLDALAALDDIELTAAFGPQHGLRGDKQDNMIESPDFTDPVHGIPVFSLYGTVRRPTAAMMDSFDVLLVDLQDVGCRIYTFVTTLRYVLEAAAAHRKAVWVLDRPNPVGRVVEGLRLRPGWESFVGAGPLPMRHGLTLGELARWFVRTLRLDVDVEVVTMEGWQPTQRAGLRLAARRAHLGQSEPERLQSLDGALLCRNGAARRHDAVRRTRHDAPARAVRRAGPRAARAAGEDGRARPGVDARLSAAPLLVRADVPQARRRAVRGRADPRRRSGVRRTTTFRPWRLVALAFKALRALRPEYDLWRDFVYEYEPGRLAIDVINGSELLRRWVDDPDAIAGDLDALAVRDETSWREERETVSLYR